MKYFTTRQEFFLCSSSIDQEEKKKLDFLLSLLDDSDVFESIKESLKKDNYQGRTRIDSHNMFATILYSFAIDGGKLRELERSCKISLDYMYLNKIYCEAINPPVINGQPFNKGAVIYVPRASVDEYRVIWSNYADRIVGYDFE